MKSKSLYFILFSALFIAAFVTSCQEDEPSILKDKITGSVQKGPFVNGTSVMVNELNSSLEQTGNVFTTQIINNAGTFEIENVSLESNYVEFSANGYYFDEVKGALSISPLTLYALSDISDISTVNVNILTHLEKQRVEYLVKQNISFKEAKKTAQTEILSIFGMSIDDMDDSETLDISVNTESNAALLALSVILQGNRSVGDLTELLADISSDISEDGILSSENILSDLSNSAKELNLSVIRTNLENRYLEVGITTTIPGFEIQFNDYLVAEGQIATEAAINDTLISCYNKLQDYIEFSYMFDAVYANRVPAPDGTWTEIYEHSQTSTNNKVLKLWSDAYEIIAKTNLILSSSQNVITDEEAKNLINAQAKTIRGYLYYNLLNWYGEIPIITEFSGILIPREPLYTVQEHIVQDAAELSHFLPQSQSQENDFRITQGFAKGLLARALLLEGNWYRASLVPQEIIDNGMYSLCPDTHNFSEGNSEIFGGFVKGGNVVFNDFFTKGSYVPVIRLTETYLVLAEALFRDGLSMDAVTKLNNLNARNGNPIINSINADELYQYWIDELDLEGNMFLVMKRFNKAISELQIPEYKLLLPVPMAALENNPNLTQNPGY